MIRDFYNPLNSSRAACFALVGSGLVFGQIESLWLSISAIPILCYLSWLLTKTEIPKELIASTKVMALCIAQSVAMVLLPLIAHHFPEQRYILLTLLGMPALFGPPLYMYNQMPFEKRRLSNL